MFWISTQELYINLKKQIKPIYILFGNDFCLLQDTQKNILKIIKELFNNTEKLKIELNINTQWNEIFNFCKTITLFSKKKILFLNCFKDYPISYFYKKIDLLSSFIHEDLILVITIYTLHQPSVYTIWKKKFNDSTIFVNCIIQKSHQLEIWIKKQIKSMGLVIENSACQLLCYYYEGNNTLIKQILKILSLIYPDGNLSLSRIKKIIRDTASFNHNHWIESVLIGKKERAKRILQQLDHININWYTLLRKIQHEVLIILKIKCNLIKGKSLYELFKTHQIYIEYRRFIITRIMQKLHLTQLQIMISVLVQMELKYQRYCMLNKSHFEILTEILCDIDNTQLYQKFSVKNII